jgi:hypothetical protein
MKSQKRHEAEIKNTTQTEWENNWEECFWLVCVMNTGGIGGVSLFDSIIIITNNFHSDSSRHDRTNTNWL